MKTIYKYSITPTIAGYNHIGMHKGAMILSLQVQGETPCIWALTDTEAPMEKRTFQTFGTGHDMPDNPGEFIGTYQVHGGTFVFHVFEIKS